MRTAATVVVAALGCLGVWAPAAGQKIVHQPAKPNFDVSGAENFRQYCAPCHGASGKGDGPVAKALKTPPADLTTIARRRHGEFPQDAIRAMILGEQDLPSHGDREMPVWGPIFLDISGKDTMLYEQRMTNLLNYLRSIQVKP